jgi:hypothetical protein
MPPGATVAVAPTAGAKRAVQIRAKVVNFSYSRMQRACGIPNFARVWEMLLRSIG